MTTGRLKIKTVGNADLPALVLVHGWGLHGGVWQSLLSKLQRHFYLHVLDLPGYGTAENGAVAQAGDSRRADWQLEALLDAFLKLPPAIWCGWSLGGMLATRFGHYAPQRVKGLVTIASNPVFVAKPEWPMAMTSTDYQQFSTALNDDVKVTLSRFVGLLCQGSVTARTDLRTLKSVLTDAVLPSQTTLQSSLQLLEQLDIRKDISTLELPQCHLLGEFDALVPAAVANAIRDLNTFADVSVIADAGHAPFLSHPDVVIEALLAVTEKR